MNSAANTATGENHPEQGSDLIPVRAGVCWLAGMAVFALPVMKWWRLTGDADAVVALIALAASLGWWWSRTLLEAAPRTSVVAALTGLAILTGELWLLVWLRIEDFWMARWGFLVITLANMLLLWGWAGPLRGLRALAALAIWMVVPPGTYFPAPDGLNESTAAVADFFLGRFYPDAVISGAVIYLPQGAIDVQGGCTVFPLWISLGLLFVPAWLIFRLSWWQALKVALMTAAAAYVFSIVRVVIMAVVVADQARFHYWHGPDGASWFTAAGMLVMAWGIDRALRRPATEDPPVTFARGQMWTLGLLAAFSVLGAIAVPWTGGHDLPDIPQEIPALSGYNVIDAKSETVASEKITGAFPFLWQRTVTYRAGLAGASIEVRLCYAPYLLAGNPVAAAVHLPGFQDGRDPEAWREITVEGVGPLREHLAPGRQAWVATLPVGAGAVANGVQWGDLHHQRLSDGSTWLRWLAGRAPLRDKRAYWLEVVWTGEGQPSQAVLRAAFTEWASVAARNSQPSTR